jgi:hypothetical protein
MRISAHATCNRAQRQQSTAPPAARPHHRHHHHTHTRTRTHARTHARRHARTHARKARKALTFAAARAPGCQVCCRRAQRLPQLAQVNQVELGAEVRGQLRLGHAAPGLAATTARGPRAAGAGLCLRRGGVEGGRAVCGMAGSFARLALGALGTLRSCTGAAAGLHRTARGQHRQVGPASRQGGPHPPPARQAARRPTSLRSASCRPAASLASSACCETYMACRSRASTLPSTTTCRGGKGGGKAVEGGRAGQTRGVARSQEPGTPSPGGAAGPARVCTSPAQPSPAQPSPLPLPQRRRAHPANRPPDALTRGQCRSPPPAPPPTPPAPSS